MKFAKFAKYFTVFLIVFIIFWASVKPSNDRNWTQDQKIMPYAEFKGDLATIYNIRNFTYSTTSNYTPDYYNKTFNLSQLDSVYYIVEPFSKWKGAAHTFLSFGFNNKDFVAISVEIRKEEGEEFSALKGLFKQYEIMYVIGDERDLVKLRSNYRKDDVFVYPVNTTKERMKILFVDMLDRTNKLKEKPEFYNTITNTCTTNIVKHVNKVVPHRVPLDLRILAPGYSDKFAYELGLIRKRGSFEETRKYYKINELAEKYADSPDFSIKIRRDLNEN